MADKDNRELIKTLDGLGKTLASVQKSIEMQNKMLERINNTFISMIDKIGTTNQILQNK